MHFFRALKVYPNAVELLMSKFRPFLPFLNHHYRRPACNVDNTDACTVYQKVVPPSVFALVVQAMQMSPGGGAPGAGGAGGGLPLGVGTGMPAPAAASVQDIDDGAPATGAGAASVGSGSGAEWENVNED